MSTSLILKDIDPMAEAQDEGMKGPYPRLLLDLATQQGQMKERLDEVVTAIAEFREERKADHFTRKDMVFAVGGSIASAGAIFAGLFFLIGTQVAPVKQQLDTFQLETAARFVQVIETLNERMKAQLDAIQANRNVNVEQQKEIDDIRLDNAKQDARLGRMDADRGKP